MEKLKIAQFVINIVCLLIIMHMEHKRLSILEEAQCKKPCDSCSHLISDNPSDNFRYHCDSRFVTRDCFDKQPNYCKYYHKREGA